MSSSFLPTSGANPRSTNIATPQQTGPLAGPTGSLSGLPVELLGAIFSFDPDSVAVLRVASRALRQNTEDFLHQNTEEIASWCSSAHSTLASLVNRELAIIRSRLGSQSDRIHIQFHMSLPRTIRSLGVPPAGCPNRIVLAHEIPPFASRIEDVNLERVWDPIRQSILIENPHLAVARVPAENASAQEIRAWMQAEANQPRLQRITHLDLNDHHLTCVPEEIGLCTGLQSLSLYNNQLVSLPEGIFRGLAALQTLSLSSNELVSLPEGIFRGLAALQALYLDNNQLASLPEGIFRGLAALQALYLDNNQLVSLPEGIFRGLANLQRLDLDNNQLVSLPEGIFRGLNALQQLSLYGNPQLLVFYNDLPEGDNISCRGTIDEFFQYACTSRFAELYQLAAGNAPLDAVQTSFSRLHVAIKNALYGKVWVEASGPIGDPEWGEHHTFEDVPRFQRALKRYVTESFELLSPDQKNGVYGHVYHLAPRQRAPVDSDVHNWGEVHAFDNILRLIDAMMRQQEQTT